MERTYPWKPNAGRRKAVSLETASLIIIDFDDGFCKNTMRFFLEKKLQGEVLGSPRPWEHTHTPGSLPNAPKGSRGVFDCSFTCDELHTLSEFVLNPNYRGSSRLLLLKMRCNNTPLRVVQRRAKKRSKKPINILSDEPIERWYASISAGLLNHTSTGTC